MSKMRQSTKSEDQKNIYFQFFHVIKNRKIESCKIDWMRKNTSQDLDILKVKIFLHTTD